MKTTAKKRPPAWTDAENAALWILYFQMLDAAIAGEAYNKAELIRLYRGDNCDAAGPLAARTRSSIEAKLMNATACHASLRPDSVTMDGHGYRALPNYQAALKVAGRVALSDRYYSRPVTVPVGVAI